MGFLDEHIILFPPDFLLSLSETTRTYFIKSIILFGLILDFVYKIFANSFDLFSIPLGILFFSLLTI